MTDIINYDNNDKLQYKPNDESKDKVEEKLDDKMKKLLDQILDKKKLNNPYEYFKNRSQELEIHKEFFKQDLSKRPFSIGIEICEFPQYQTEKKESNLFMLRQIFEGIRKSQGPKREHNVVKVTWNKKDGEEVIGVIRLNKIDLDYNDLVEEMLRDSFT